MEKHKIVWNVFYVISRHLCELNSRTKEARPEDYVQDADRVYLTRPSERGIEFKMRIISVLITKGIFQVWTFVCLFAFSLLFVFHFVLCFLHMSNEASKGG